MFHVFRPYNRNMKQRNTRIVAGDTTIIDNGRGPLVVHTSWDTLVRLTQQRVERWTPAPTVPRVRSCASKILSGSCGGCYECRPDLWRR